MIKQDHLQVYDLSLTTCGLLFIGCGKELPKKEYILNTRADTVSFLDERKFFDLLIQCDLVDSFESFCMRAGGDLYQFLHQTCKLTPEQVAPAVRYTIRADGALDADHSLKKIQCFMRNAQGQVYVPGSSVKGALRTALLYARIAAEGRLHSQQTLRNKIPEETYLHTLNCTGNQRNAINSLMRGVQVSDSEPVANTAMTLALKNDGFIDGGTKAIPICRECIAPGVTMHCRLTLDQSILHNQITAESIMNAVNAFDRFYQRTYARHFVAPHNSMQPGNRSVLFLGGGAGFFTKSLAYPYLGERQGLKFVADMLTRKFNKHHHERDIQLGISPHTMKYGKYRRGLQPFGACEVSIR